MKKTLITTLIATALLSSSLSAVAGKACRDVSFRVFNDTGTTIRFRNIAYRNISSGRNRVENVGSMDCPDNTLCNSNRGYRIRDAKDSRLSNFVLRFRAFNTAELQFETAEAATFVPNDEVCVAGRRYGGQNWRITADDLPF